VHGETNEPAKKTRDSQNNLAAPAHRSIPITASYHAYQTEQHYADFPWPYFIRVLFVTQPQTIAGPIPHRTQILLGALDFFQSNDPFLSTFISPSAAVRGRVGICLISSDRQLPHPVDCQPKPIY
jgi:hypothetical protein